jgi:hypothetical protein
MMAGQTMQATSESEGQTNSVTRSKGEIHAN